MVNRYFDSIFFGSILMGLTYVIAYSMGWVNLAEINYLEIFAVWTSFICTLLCVHQSSWNYPIGMVTTAAYSYLFFQWNLPSVAWFNLYLVFSLAYGWWFWGPDSNPKSFVTRITAKEWPVYVGVAVLVFSLLLIINTIFGYETTVADALVAILSGVAQWMLDRRKIETWAVWAVVNVVSIYLYYNQGLYLVTLQYVYFLGNTLYGFYMWKQTMEKEI